MSEGLNFTALRLINISGFMCLSRVLQLLAQRCPPFAPSFSPSLSLSSRAGIVSFLMRSSTNKVGFYAQSSHSSSLQLPFPAKLVMKAFMIFFGVDMVAENLMNRSIPQPETRNR